MDWFDDSAYVYFVVESAFKFGGVSFPKVSVMRSQRMSFSQYRTQKVAESAQPFFQLKVVRRMSSQVFWELETVESRSVYKSGTGYIIMFANCPIFQTSKLQSDIVLLTTEAEYISLSQTMHDLIPLLHHLTGSVYNLWIQSTSSNNTPQIPSHIHKISSFSRSCLERSYQNLLDIHRQTNCRFIYKTTSSTKIDYSLEANPRMVSLV